ncbi:hypothetical protein VFPPC_18174 [Pochonia chlamydosporia 170]|uniref:Uncharacterized protein n=1 Tax=Pochonia chlamydosporia 170 TaxID=1380566 RepID=A0A219AS52_METCM|nr:hypothetical protein VFPPC_18174 [Pochonia chlamydosporia 170]OWT43623.1 hypothetical protein VFPPC_18174 [Pochonia chlamydosporia 170]
MKYGVRNRESSDRQAFKDGHCIRVVADIAVDIRRSCLNSILLSNSRPITDSLSFATMRGLLLLS